MDGSRGEGTALNSFALVAYLPDPLIGFIDKLRQEIEPGCHLRAHLTFLPPRSLTIPLEQIEKQLAENLRNCQPFQINLGEVQAFPESHVVYLAIEDGLKETKRIHDLLNQGDLKFLEKFDYHPHVTLGQNLVMREVDAAKKLAIQRWDGYRGDHFFVADHLTLVQNVGVDRWKNLHDFYLGAPVAA